MDTLEVEGLDDALGPQEVLGAARGRLDPGQRLAVDLGNPEAELVGFATKKKNCSINACYYLNTNPSTLCF